MRKMSKDSYAAEIVRSLSEHGIGTEEELQEIRRFLVA